MQKTHPRRKIHPHNRSIYHRAMGNITKALMPLNVQKRARVKGKDPSVLALVFSYVDMSTLLIRYEIDPSFAKQTYRVRQHISNAVGVYRKSRKGFISMRVLR